MKNNKKIFTFGCKLNIFESEVIDKMTSEAKNNYVIFNTCAVTNEAVRKAKQKIRKIKIENPSLNVIVTGCAAQIEPKIFSEMNEVNFVVGNKEKLEKKTWSNILNCKDDKLYDKIISSNIMDVKKTANHLISGFGTRTRAYIEIQNGCDHRCTFCIIPFGRGNSRSVPPGIIIEQIKNLSNNGYKEIVLTGVDITSYGNDLFIDINLGDLIEKILVLVPKIERIRLSSLDTIEIDDKLFELITQNDRIMPHLHLSLQSGDDLILKRMKRRHTRKDAISFCEEIKDKRPEIVFGADLIAGFPTETNEMFNNTIDLIEKCGLTFLHIFPFSSKKGTPASRMPQVKKNILKQRTTILKEIKNKKEFIHLSNSIGKKEEVLSETENYGRAKNFTYVNFTKPQKTGEILQTFVVGKKSDCLIGKVII